MPIDSLEVGTLLWASLAWRLAIGYHITVVMERGNGCEPMSESSWHVQYALCTILGRLWPHKKTIPRPDVLRLHIQMTLCTCQAYPSFFMTGETHWKQPPSPSTTTHLCLCLYPLHLRLEWSIPCTIQVCICVIWQEEKKRCLGFCHIHIRAVFAFECANNLPNIKRLLSAVTYEVPHYNGETIALSRTQGTLFNVTPQKRIKQTVSEPVASSGCISLCSPGFSSLPFLVSGADGSKDFP